MNSTFHLHGGVGGSGGGAGAQGNGGNGGTGEGPTVNIGSVGNLHMNDQSLGLHILHRAVALAALHDSAESFPQPKCHPETRTKLLDNLYNWAIDLNSHHSIHWLHGPAGAGKSAVMQTLCRRLEESGWLGGSFFFKRGHSTCGSAKVLFPTLAYQLAFHRHELMGPISRSVERDLSVVGRCMDVQLKNLILEPFKLAGGASPSVLLIDGLDECDGHNIQREILRLIGSTADDPHLALRILVASRPEPHIRETLEAFRGLFDSTNIEQSFEDVRTYLCDEFLRIHREHASTMTHIPTPWPSPQILDQLVQNSSGYFVYASTIIKFVDDEYFRPSRQLDIIIQKFVPHPFAALDQLYIQILSAVPSRHYPILYDILSVIIHLPAYLSAEEMEDLLGLEPGDVSLILRPLHSVLALRSDRGVEVHHASFRDFLGNQQRSSNFYVGSPQHRAKVAGSFLRALAYKYEDQQKNAKRHGFRGQFSMNDPQWMEWITSVTPSQEFVPLVWQINADFIFIRTHKDAEIENFIMWLKRIHPVPEDLIRLWEDYRYMNSWSNLHSRAMSNLLKQRKQWCPERPETHVLAPSLHITSTLLIPMDIETPGILETCQGLLSQSPLLRHILQASRLDIFHATDLDRYLLQNCAPYLFWTHAVLNVSWDDIRECICSLRPLLSQGSGCFYTLVLCLLCWELYSSSTDPMASMDLASGFLELMRRVGNAELPDVFCYRFDHPYAQWGRYIRSSPQPAFKLIQELAKFSPCWSLWMGWKILEPVEFHDVVQWLETYPDPQPDLINQWQGYLKESIARNGTVKRHSHTTLEKRWLDHLAGEEYFHGSPRAFDEKIIQCWERCLRRFQEPGSGTGSEEGRDSNRDEDSDNGDEDDE